MYNINICKGPGRLWYVSRLPKNLDPKFDYMAFEYLHQDGEWRPTTYHNGEYSGYFSTKEKAKEVLDSVSEKGEWK